MAFRIVHTRRRDPGPGGRPGFSLIELVLVLMTLAVLALIAVPVFSGAADRARVRGASQLVISEIQQIGQLAYATSLEHEIRFKEGRDSMVSYQAGSNTPVRVLSLGSRDLGVELRILEAAPYSNTLSLDHAGEATSQAFLRLRAGNATTTILQPLGVIRPSQSELSGWSDELALSWIRASGTAPLIDSVTVEVVEADDPLSVEF